MFDIRQRPFAFQHNELRGPAGPRGPKTRRRGMVHERLLTLSPQVKALCTYCGNWYQKDSKSLLNKACSYCTCKGYIHIIPAALRPWKLHDPKENGYCEGHHSFNCRFCNLFFYSWGVLGCLCPKQTDESKLVTQDERHRVLSTCRFCCYIRYPWLYDPTVSRTDPNIVKISTDDAEAEVRLNKKHTYGELNRIYREIGNAFEEQGGNVFADRRVAHHAEINLDAAADNMAAQLAPDPHAVLEAIARAQGRVAARADRDRQRRERAARRAEQERERVARILAVAGIPNYGDDDDR